MSIRVVGAGLPRTGTSSLRYALERLLGGTCCHMSAIPGHPFDLGPGWNGALHDQPTDWDRLMEPYRAAVDWPASLFWRELHMAFPDALVLLSSRTSAEEWLQSLEATIMPYARLGLADDWTQGRHLVDLFERFTGSPHWDDPQLLMRSYDRHNSEVRATIPGEQLVDWHPSRGWEPICGALSLRIPEEPFPWKNKREDWK